MSLRLEIIDDMDMHADRLASAWSGFDSLSIPVGLEWNRLVSWWNQYGNINNPRIGFNKRPKIVLIYNGKKIEGILPLMQVERIKKRIIRMAQLEFFTQSFNGQYLDIVQSTMSIEEIRDVFKLVSQQLHYDLIDLSYLREDSVLVKAGIGETSFHSGKVIIPLDMSYEKIRTEIYSKNLRHVLNKFNRRIRESKVNIRSEVLEGRENIEKIKNSIKQVSLSKLNDPEMHSLYQDPAIGDMYFDSIINKDRPFCSVYLADDRLLSYNMGYTVNDVVYAFDAAYNREYAESQKIGLGILAYDNLVEKYAGKYKQLDMGFGLDDYKFRFSKNILFTYSLLIKGNTFKAGLLYKHTVNKRRQFEQVIRERIKNYIHDK